MPDPSRTNQALIEEISILKQKIQELEQAESARRQADAKLKDAYAEMQLFRNALDQISSYIYMKDLQFRYIYANRLTLELFGCSSQELVGRDDNCFFPPETVKRLREVDLRVLQGEHTAEEIDVLDAEGGRRVYWEIKVPIYSDPESRKVWGLLGISNDITERKQMMDSLRRSAENFRHSLDDSPLGVRIVTAAGECIYANRAILDVYGYDSIDELSSTPVKKRYTPESYAEFQIRKEKRKRGDHFPSEYEVSIIRKDGEVRHLQVFRKRIYWDGTEQFQVMYHDITERKRMQYAFRESEEQYHLLFENMMEGVAYCRMIFAEGRPQDFLYLAVNKAFKALTGLEDVVGRKVTEVIPGIKEANPELLEVYGRVALTGKPERVESYLDSLKAWLSISVYSPAKECFVAVFDNITERKRAEERMWTSREQMRALAKRLQEVREEERTLIAREIHDELGGALTGLKIDVALLKRAMVKMEEETVRTSLLAGMDSIIEFTDKTIRTVRRIAMELRPGILDDLGLVAALEWQLKDFSVRTGIRCELFPPGEDISFDADVATTLFRIFQEALTNVARHSAATEVCVRFRVDADSITLELEDNGNGIEKEKILSKQSLGLLGMRERAQLHGGCITIVGTLGRGTILTVAIPPGEKIKMDEDQGGTAG